MIRLTETGRHGQRVSLRVEGWIAGEASRLLEVECTTILDAGHTVLLDCAHVTLVDRRGASILRRLLARGLTIVACAPLILDFVGGTDGAR